MNSKSSQPVELSILQINPGASGGYTVSGSTTLPDRTKITVSAVRYFGRTNAADSALAAVRQNFAILDRQIAEVNQGTWQTRLNLQTLANGQLQEAWQSSVAPNQLTPDPAVTFLATLEPTHQTAPIQREIETGNAAAITRFTTDGELYLQATKTLSLPVEGEVRPAAFNAPQPVRVTVAEVPDNQPVRQPQTDLPASSEIWFR